jgi:hypothetical protein
MPGVSIIFPGGKVNPRGVASCVDCNAFLRARIDYGSLTDALVWSYLFEEIGVPLICNNADVSFVDVVTILPAVRASDPPLVII